MDSYNRAYRDPRSPLTPLTAIRTSTATTPTNAFNFDFAANKNIRHETTTTTTPRTHLKVPEQKFRNSTNNTSNNNNYSNYNDQAKIGMASKKHCRCITTKRTSATSKIATTTLQLPKECVKVSSPIGPKPPISPRLCDLLKESGLAKFIGLFQREEIDTAVFCILKVPDLKALGINSEVDQAFILKAIKCARNLFKC